jgi:DNA-binding NarL/FixJ family response regulator
MAAPAPLSHPVPTAPLRRPCIVLSGADAALGALLAEWLGELADLQLAPDPPAAVPAADLHIVDVPFPRRADAAADTPARAVPVLMLSATFLGAIDCHGPVAAALGVDGVLPKPVAREALLAAVRRLLASRAAPADGTPP